MSNFNNPPGQQYQPGGYQPQGNFNPPSQKGSGGGNVLLIVLIIVGGLFLAAIGACVFLAMMVKSTVDDIGGQISGLAAEGMTESIVSQYEEDEEFVKLIGEVKDFEIEDKELGFEVFTTRRLVILVEGDKANGSLILYRKGGKPDRVTLEVGGEEILLDDDPKEFLGSDTEIEWDEEFGEDTGPGFGEEEFATPPGEEDAGEGDQ